ncbi:hypothetical protein FLL45_00230 [Aliikangiella marina]|uniref:Uncharacterized protein n=1 Tax=Aliikangiella marina TaxID=1712262 RepID=A0A545TGR6_9GAMM|nr:hypothetical protein [Aliikangiella marina]TQV76430.1 hypothetical protein FLL45_00230 [Aliikangiella marina]
MILLVCKPGSERFNQGNYSLASLAQYSFDYKPMEYGFTYNILSQSPPPPKVQMSENIFIASQNVYFEECLNGEVIGDCQKDSAILLNPKQLFDKLTPLLPSEYSGVIYINACTESERTTLDFAESFDKLIQNIYATASAYGRISGTVAMRFDGGVYPVIPPSRYY